MNKVFSNPITIIVLLLVGTYVIYGIITGNWTLKNNKLKLRTYSRNVGAKTYCNPNKVELCKQAGGSLNQNCYCILPQGRKRLSCNECIQTCLRLGSDYEDCEIICDFACISQSRETYPVYAQPETFVTIQQPVDGRPSGTNGGGTPPAGEGESVGRG